MLRTAKRSNSEVCNSISAQPWDSAPALTSAYTGLMSYSSHDATAPRIAHRNSASPMHIPPHLYTGSMERVSSDVCRPAARLTRRKHSSSPAAKGVAAAEAVTLGNNSVHAVHTDS